MMIKAEKDRQAAKQQEKAENASEDDKSFEPEDTLV
jgi:hypothetical protein